MCAITCQQSMSALPCKNKLHKYTPAVKLCLHDSMLVFERHGSISAFIALVADSLNSSLRDMPAMKKSPVSKRSMMAMKAMKALSEGAKSKQKSSSACSSLPSSNVAVMKLKSTASAALKSMAKMKAMKATKSMKKMKAMKAMKSMKSAKCCYSAPLENVEIVKKGVLSRIPTQTNDLGYCNILSGIWKSTVSAYLLKPCLFLRGVMFFFRVSASGLESIACLFLILESSHVVLESSHVCSWEF